MSVFLLSAGKDPASITEPKPAVVAGEGPAAQKAKEGELLNEDQVNERAGKEDGKTETVVMTGPLGYYYTDALNKEYALEDMTGMSLVAELLTEREQIVKAEEEAAGYVYVVDARDLNAESMTTALEALDRYKASGKKVLLAMEYDGSVSTNMNILLSHAHSQGIRVGYGLKGVARAIESMLGR